MPVLLSVAVFVCMFVYYRGVTYFTCDTVMVHQSEVLCVCVFARMFVGVR